MVSEPAVALMPAWLDIPAIPGLEIATWDSGEPVPSDDVLKRVVFFVPPYMGSLADVALAARMPRLQVVQALMAGVDGMAEVLPPGVELRRAVGVHDTSTSELAVGLILAAQRGIAAAARDMDSQMWLHTRHPSLADSRVAVVGWGGVGQAIAARLSPFEVTVCAFSRTGSAGSSPVAEFAERAGEFDIVVLALPLTPGTSPFLDEAMLSRLADGCLVVNVGRGGLIHTDALVTQLRAGRLRAALDVTDPEPLPAGHPLWTCPGLLITPHLGGDSGAFVPRARRMVGEQLAHFVAELSE